MRFLAHSVLACRNVHGAIVVILTLASLLAWITCHTLKLYDKIFLCVALSGELFCTWTGFVICLS